jgi:pyruvyl transferase EpsO
MEEQEKMLDAIKLQLRPVAQVLSRSAELVYVDYPVHDNVGDQLINLGTEVFFSENNLNVKARFSINDLCLVDVPDGRPVVPRETFRALDRILAGKATLVCHGGGNFGTLYRKYNAFRLHLLSRYQATPIVVLPQTVHFENEAAQRETMEAFRRHGSALVFARDSKSLELLRTAGVPSQLSPDMAHALWRSASFATPSSEGVGELVLARRDKETKISPGALSSRRGSQWMDWPDLAQGWESEFVRAFAAIQRRNRFVPLGSKTLQLCWYGYRDLLVRRAVAAFGRVKTIYTDRLHALLLGALLGKETLFMDNSYGKLGSYWSDWLRSSTRIRQIDSLPFNDVLDGATGDRIPKPE